MSVPSWWAALLLGGAAFRTYRLLAQDIILDRPRAWLLRLPLDWEDGDFIPEGFRDKWSTFLLCPWCLGAWLSLAWWGAWQVWPHATLVVAGLALISAFVGLVAQLDQGED
jgi:hypothetical protein